MYVCIYKNIHMMIERWPKIMAPILWELLKGDLHPMQRYEDWTSSKNAWELQRKMRKIILRFESVLSLLTTFYFSLSSSSSGLIFHTLFLFSWWLQEVLLQINFCISELRWCLVCLSFFLMVRLQWGSD